MEQAELAVKDAAGADRVKAVERAGATGLALDHREIAFARNAATELNTSQGKGVLIRPVRNAM